MRNILLILFYLNAFIIFWAMVGYPLSLRVLRKIYKNRRLEKDLSYEPTVTVMIVAHNEEKVILQKLQNVIELDYPKDKIEFLVASDNSTDRTNKIVKDFISKNKEYRIRLYEVKVRKGKTNAQNESQKTVESEILVMTDANALMKGNAIKELVSTFSSPDISYVAGRLILINKDVSYVTECENFYWDSESMLKKIESDIQTITAGNGAIYACRNSQYYDFDPIKCHDGSMPRYFALQKKRALFNPDAIAYEKAGEVIEDEFKRKVRMNRGILNVFTSNLNIFNVFKYRWYSYFHFGHRRCRNLLWLAHLIIAITNLLLAFNSIIYLCFFVGQVTFYLLAFVKKITKSKNKYLNLIYYYTITILAQWCGAYNMLTGKSKPFWEKAESTR